MRLPHAVTKSSVRMQRTLRSKSLDGGGCAGGRGVETCGDTPPPPNRANVGLNMGGGGRAAGSVVITGHADAMYRAYWLVGNILEHAERRAEQSGASRSTPGAHGASWSSSGARPGCPPSLSLSVQCGQGALRAAWVRAIPSPVWLHRIGCRLRCKGTCHPPTAILIILTTLQFAVLLVAEFANR